MTETILTHDAGVSAFEDADGVVQSTDDDGVQFSWDEENIVRVDAPADLTGAFDTERFYKIEGATVARPIKQPYMVGDDIDIYKKPADELSQAAWTFDNVPFTLGHPDTGMVKSVDDIHGFWRNPRYDADEHRLKEDLYVPTNDEDAIDWIEEHSDVSVGFFNRVHSDYDGNTGDLHDDDVDGFQVDIYGNHIAGVEQGRCSSEHGCGLDEHVHGRVAAGNDATTAFEGPNSTTPTFSEGDRVRWMADAVVAHNPDDEEGVMIEILDDDGNSTEMVTTVSEDSIMPATDDDISTDQPSGIYQADDGTWLAVAPDEHTKDSTEHPDDAMFPVDSCADVEDAWGLRGHSSNLEISEETLANRIERVDEAKDCGVVPEETDDSTHLDLDEVDGYHPWKSTDDNQDCNCTNTNMADDNDTATDDGFDIPDLSVDALAEKNDAVQELVESRDSFREDLDEMRTEIEDAFDSAEHFSVDLEEDECPCEAVEDLVADLDEKAEQASKVEDLRDELSEYREDEIEDRLDTLDELGAERDEWEETADEADDPLDVLDEEIERRKEVLDAAPEATVKDIESSTDSEDEETTDAQETTMSGTRRFGRGHNA